MDSHEPPKENQTVTPSHPEPTSPQIVGRPKRHQIVAACERCRRQKRKCDGNRPCSPCKRASAECVYTTQANESHQLATKRKFDELSQAHEDVQTVFSLLAGRDEALALSVFSKIRAGQSPASIVAHSRGLPHDSNNTWPTRQTKAHHELLVALTQSTAPLADIARVAEQVIRSQRRPDLPMHKALRPLRHTLITLDSVVDALAHFNPTCHIPQIDAPATSSLPPLPSGDGDDEPLYDVPAAPWTALNVSDSAVSHLVSAFLTVMNPYWRFVEDDLFVRHMRSQDLNSPFCSPFLVNAVLACGSLFSEIDEAFVTPGEMLTRGEHFHNQAFRLWAREAQLPSLVNVQAILVLTMDSAWRGKDAMGWPLMQNAAMQETLLTMPQSIPKSSQQASDYRRARHALAHSTLYNHITWARGLQKGPKALPDTLADSPPSDRFLPDSIEYWVAYPISRSPTPFFRNKLYYERWNLIQFISEGGHIFPPLEEHALEGDRQARITSLAERVARWCENMPAGLQYHPQMPIPLFEFHAQCLSERMLVYEQWTQETTRAATKENSSPHLHAQAKELRRQALALTRQSADFLRDFRQRYGYKMVPPFVMHVGAMACNIQICAFERSSMRTSTVSEPPNGGTIDDQDGFRDANIDAFQECFRAVLATGLQMMLPRGLARMLYLTANRLEVELPETVQRVLAVVADAAWQPTDVLKFDSTYPNLAMVVKQLADAEDYQMSKMLRAFDGLTAA